MNRLKLLRYEAGARAADVAAATGMTPSNLYAIEAGRTRPTAPTARRLADFYGVSVAEVLGIVDEPDGAAA